MFEPFGISEHFNFYISLKEELNFRKLTEVRLQQKGKEPRETSHRLGFTPTMNGHT
jgi:hypothetical protein